MKAINIISVLVVTGLAAIMFSGCSQFMNINERAVSVEDIINMTKAEVGEDVIMRHIEVTRSRFELSSDQIIQLKKAGVGDKVLEAMIDTEDRPEHFDWEYGYSPNEYWSNYYNQWYPAYTYYPSGYPTYSYSSSVYPYSIYRRSGLVGRFYRYVPIYPPMWNYNRQRWTMPGEQDSLLKEEEK